MKKLLYLFLLLTLGTLTSCSSSDTINDEPTQTLDFTVTFQNVATRGDNIYVVKDTKFYISSASLSATSRSASPVSKVEYYMDSRLRVRNVFAPFNATFDTRSLASGTHELNMNYELLNSDNTMSSASKKFNVTVVDSADQLPEGAVLGEVSRTFTVSVH